MSLFRPARKVTDPRGREWEIYVSYYATPEWQPNDYDELGDDFVGIPAAGGLVLVSILLELPRFLYHQVLVPIARFLVVTPYRYFRGRRSSTIWIEAIFWDVAPRRDTIRWTTTADHVDRVLDQITSGLAAGDVPRPLGCEFLGRSSNY